MSNRFLYTNCLQQDFYMNADHHGNIGVHVVHNITTTINTHEIKLTDGRRNPVRAPLVMKETRCGSFKDV